MPTLSEQDDKYLSENFSELEFAIALKEMKINKSPGSYGITTEFYTIFWNDVKKYYIKSIKYSFEHQYLAELQKRALLHFYLNQIKTPSIFKTGDQ